MDTNTFLLLALIVIVALIAYVVWRNNKVKVTTKVGPAELQMETEKQEPKKQETEKPSDKPASQPASPGAELKAGNVTGSLVVNEGAGADAKAEVEDINNSTVINTRYSRDRAVGFLSTWMPASLRSCSWASPRSRRGMARAAAAPIAPDRHAAGSCCGCDARRLTGTGQTDGADILNSRVINAAGDIHYHEATAPAAHSRITLPARRPFVGRADLLADIERRLRSDDTVGVTSLKGIAGVGKSVLALEVAYRFEKLFPDGRYWLDLRGVDTTQALRTFLIQLGVVNAEQLQGGFDALRGLMADALANRRVLLVLDNERASPARRCPICAPCAWRHRARPSSPAGR